ncbi:MAG: hypothetical protein H6558_00275 [Lewinellaceae bacterium]|nr:hypothetical protein [Lewinellaceae bacterium]
MTRILLSILLTGFSLFTACGQRNMEIIAILCGQTEVFDIGAGCQANIEKVTGLLDDVGESLELRVRYIYCTGQDYNKVNILRVLDGLNITNPDSSVVIFYGTGHGFNYQDQPSEFAFLGAHPSRKQLSQSEFTEFGLSLEHEVHRRLLAKDVRLLITMGEACNNVLKINAPQNLLADGFIAMSPNSEKARRYAELFLEPEGEIISTSSQYSEFSWIDNTDVGGGVWTNQFLRAFNETASGNRPADWGQIFQRTVEYTQDATEDMETPQTPFYDENLIRTPMEVSDSNQKRVSPGKAPKVTLKESGYIAPRVRVIQYEKKKKNKR